MKWNFHLPFYYMSITVNSKKSYLRYLEVKKQIRFEENEDVRNQLFKEMHKLEKELD